MTLNRLVLVLVLATLVAPPAHAAEGEDSHSGKSYMLEEGQSHKGDLYLYSGSVRIGGVQAGDVTAFTESLTVSGEVTGDMYVMAHRITITGKVGDSARFFGGGIKV